MGSSDALLSTSFKPLLHGAASGGMPGPVQRALEAVVRQLNQEQVSCLVSCAGSVPAMSIPANIVSQYSRPGPQQLVQPDGRSVQCVTSETLSCCALQKSGKCFHASEFRLAFAPQLFFASRSWQRAGPVAPCIHAGRRP